MGKLKIHAGDWYGVGEFVVWEFKLPKPLKVWDFDKIKASELKSIEIANEESVKRVGGTVGWGAVGATLLGPVGLLAGLLVGGRGKDVTFVAHFKDGRKLLATTDSKTFTAIQAQAFT